MGIGLAAGDESGLSANDPIAHVGKGAEMRAMVEIVDLAAGEWMPEMPDEEPWLIVEASNDGRFFGTGFAYKPTGESVFYASLPENDLSFEVALAAATEWAAKYGVARVWVQATPD